MLMSITEYNWEWAKYGVIFVILPGKPQMFCGGEMPSLPSGSHSAKPGSQPKNASQPDVCASPQEKPLRTLAHQAEEEVEDGGLFIPMGRLSFFFLLKSLFIKVYAKNCT